MGDCCEHELDRHKLHGRLYGWCYDCNRRCPEEAFLTRADAAEWRPVPTHLGYEVNKLGQIKGPSGRVLQPMRAHSGHLYVLAPLPRRPRKLFVHRAVLLAFVGPPVPGQESRHLNGNPADNRLRNLVWGTRVENAGDKQLHGTQRRGEQTRAAKLTEAQVLEIRRRVNSETLRALAAEYGVSHTAIRRAANGIKWAHLQEATDG